jgi:O-methyltransferase involved in polyketide biosynthesis
MDDERPSVTAEGAAVMRALHQKLDDDPKILDDPISARLVDEHSDFTGRASNSWSVCLRPPGCGSKPLS